MILLTGAAGKTGLTILKYLSSREVAVRALVRNQKQAENVGNVANTEPFLGDLEKPETLPGAFRGVDAVYAISPNMSPNELSINKSLIHLAMENQVSRFVYHSVLHPQVGLMPHHWQKMLVEEALFTSGLDFTILQPCAYMQNILSGWEKILAGEYSVPYNLGARISIVDLEDVAKVAAKVLTETGFSHAIYELAGPEPLTQNEVAHQISAVIHQPVKAVEQSRQDWQHNALASGMLSHQVELLTKMFEYYDKFGLIGNSSVLEYLLGSKPTTFNQFVTRITSSEGEG